MANNSKKEVAYKETMPKDWVEEIIVKGVEMAASDIHIEPTKEKINVRFRIDGILREIDSPHLSFLNPIISILKVMANLDITESRRPQDGHILFKPKSMAIVEPIDLRLSIFPSVFGEVAVIRILNRKDLLFENVEKLGIGQENIDKLQFVLQQSNGMVLVTGPAGSGKTTTLYTILNSLKSPKGNIITLEDPVELYLDGIRQCQIHPEVGFGFAKGLKSILRQDPNVVMVGEIRDNETAEISIRAALSGVLFLSTMHTTNSIGAIIRLLELGLPRSLIAFSLRAIIAQRLLRVVCPYCKTSVEPSKKIVKTYGVFKKDKLKVFQGKGCDACNGSGFQGRTGVFELLFINKEIQQLIIENVSFKVIEEQAKRSGMKTLQEIAVAKALNGITTFEEVIRAVPTDE